jgi:hypothetical protein
VTLLPFRTLPFARLIVTLLAVATPAPLLAWGAGHRIITRAALEAMPAELLEAWSVAHRHPLTHEERSLADWLSERFCMHPDWVDGPSRSGDDIEERRRITQFVYAEKEGAYLPPVAWADPDRDPKLPRPWTYHYFTRPVEEVNRAFAEAGARWYFSRIAEAFREGNFVAATEYCGAFAHAIEDRVSPFHVWDGYAEEREALEDSLAEHGLQSPEGSRGGDPKGTSLFWGLDGPRMKADLSGYEPKTLGKSVDEAAAVFAGKLFENREFAKAVYTDPEGFLSAHLADDWRATSGSPETDLHLSKIASHNARLVADVFYTAWSLAGAVGE